MDSIYGYTDFRLFLKDYYDAHKSVNPNFSYRFIALKVGFKSPGHFTQILSGTANLSNKLLPKFTEFMKLNKREAEYFELLVNYSQSKSNTEKQRYFERISTMRGSQFNPISKDQYEFYQKWYYSAVRDLLSIYTFSGEDYRGLGKMLIPSITTDEARAAIALLSRLNMIAQNEAGVWQATDTIIVTPEGDEFSTILANYAIQMIELAKEAVNTQPKNQRSVSWAGMSCSQATFLQIQDEIRQFRKRMLALAEADRHPEKLFHFNIQCIPLSRPLPSPPMDGVQ